MRLFMLLLLLFLYSNAFCDETKPSILMQECELIESYDRNSDQLLSSVIRQLVAGVADKDFDEALIQRIAKKEKESSEGEYIEYWENGQMKVRASWKNGRPEGHIHGWYSNGEHAFKGYFKEGKKLGIHIVFYSTEACRSNEPIARLYSYNEKGRLSGEQETDYPNTGNLKAELNFYDGRLHGEQFLWGPEIGKGSIEERKYDHGKLISVKK